MFSTHCTVSARPPLSPQCATSFYTICRSDGSLVVANKEKEEKVLAPPGCGATIAYRLGYYNILLPKTTHSEEKLICTQIGVWVQLVWLLFGFVLGWLHFCHHVSISGKAGNSSSFSRVALGSMTGTMSLHLSLKVWYMVRHVAL